MGGKPKYRGLKKNSKLILSENRRPYSLKQKKRIEKDGSEGFYWACDTSQNTMIKWGCEVGIPNFTTHSGMKPTTCHTNT